MSSWPVPAFPPALAYLIFAHQAPVCTPNWKSTSYPFPRLFFIWNSFAYVSCHRALSILVHLCLARRPIPSHSFYSPKSSTLRSSRYGSRDTRPTDRCCVESFSANTYPLLSSAIAREEQIVTNLHASTIRARTDTTMPDERLLLEHRCIGASGRHTGGEACRSARNVLQLSLLELQKRVRLGVRQRYVHDSLSRLESAVRCLPRNHLQ